MSDSEISVYEKFNTKLAPFRDAAIGYVEGLKQADHRVIFHTYELDADDLELDRLYQYTEEGTTFHAIKSRPKIQAGEDTWNDQLDEKLRLPAFFAANCSKVVYCLLPLVRRILGADQSFKKAVWAREYIDPELIMVDVDSNGDQRNRPLPLLAHDFIKIFSQDGQVFVLDVTGDQFGIRQWFFKKRRYYENYVIEDIVPESASEAKKEADVLGDDPRNEVLKAAVRTALEEVKTQWDGDGVHWEQLHLTTEGKQREFRDSAALEVKRKVVAALTG